MIKHRFTTVRTAATAGLTGLALVLGGCAGPGERPSADLQSADSALQQAVAADAREYQPVLLNDAQNKVADAKNLIDKEQFRKAERLLEQATVDAQLAGARSETAKARQAVEEINRNIEEQRQRLNRGQ